MLATLFLVEALSSQVVLFHQPRAIRLAVVLANRYLVRSLHIFIQLYRMYSAFTGIVKFRPE
jgi:hypothetical protein